MKYYTVEEAAEKIGVSIPRIYELVSNGILKSSKYGLIEPNSLDTYMVNGEKPKHVQNNSDPSQKNKSRRYVHATKKEIEFFKGLDPRMESSYLIETFYQNIDPNRKRTQRWVLDKIHYYSKNKYISVIKEPTKIEILPPPPEKESDLDKKQKSYWKKIKQFICKLLGCYKHN